MESLEPPCSPPRREVMSVMTRWPVKNHHTDITSVMCAKKNQMKTLVWDPIHDVPVGLVI